MKQTTSSTERNRYLLVEEYRRSLRVDPEEEEGYQQREEEVEFRKRFREVGVLLLLQVEQVLVSLLVLPFFAQA